MLRDTFEKINIEIFKSNISENNIINNRSVTVKSKWGIPDYGVPNRVHSLTL